jgi:hypothetical protein
MKSKSPNATTRKVEVVLTRFQDPVSYEAMVLTGRGPRRVKDYTADGVAEKVARLVASEIRNTYLVGIQRVS